MGTAYPSPTKFWRTPLQKKDMFAAWERDDQSFFASGACHILAYSFYWLHQDEGYDIVYTKPKGAHPGNHVYVLKHGWCFDFAGWTRESELLEVMRDDYSKQFVLWDIERLLITEMPLEEFCRQYNHRPPAYYAYLPWERASNFIQKFDSAAPEAFHQTPGIQR